MSEEFLQKYKKSQKVAKKKLRIALHKLDGLSNSATYDIVTEVFGEDLYLKAQELLNSQYKRTKFVKQSMQYVAPVELILNKTEVEVGKPKDVVHYVPLITSLSNLLMDKTLSKMMSKIGTNDRKTGSISDVMDGTLSRSSVFFKNNSDALPLILYSDALEIRNPLGAARGVYKVVQVFYTLGNIPMSQRSKVDRIQLLMVFREKLTKKYSYDVLYARLLEDLKKLETGVKIGAPEEKLLKAGLLMHAADNLESHLVGGFSASFSSGSICRFCHIQHEHLDYIHDYAGELTHEVWTIDEYNAIANSLETQSPESIVAYVDEEDTTADDEDSDDFTNDSFDDSDEDSELVEESDNVNKWGVERPFVLNVLRSFHCVTSLPPDLLHDHFEGVVAEDLLSIIRALVQKGWFSIEMYNDALIRYGWIGLDRLDKPQPVPSARGVKKLKGKACSLWVHMRNFPLILKKFIRDSNDDLLHLALKLHEVTERLTAVEFLEYEIQLVEESIIDYLNMRSAIRVDMPDIFGRPKPKHHFIRLELLHMVD